jgi:hypothetical protein
MHHSEFYSFASSYWWLIFPVGWGLVALLRIWTQHRQAQATLDLLKSYVDQGKEPPAALLETVLPETTTRWTYQPLHFWLGALSLGAGAVGFAALTWLRSQQGDPDSANALFIAILLGAGAVACAIFAVIVRAGKTYGPDAP